jgi:hypothetical protein
MSISKSISLSRWNSGNSIILFLPLFLQFLSFNTFWRLNFKGSNSFSFLSHFFALACSQMHLMFDLLLLFLTFVEHRTSKISKYKNRNNIFCTFSYLLDFYKNGIFTPIIANSNAWLRKKTLVRLSRDEAYFVLSCPYMLL